MMSLFISPHNDDETLFGAYTLMRVRPLVLIVTDSFIQGNRGDNITAEDRRKETISAMAMLGCSVVFGGLRDDNLNKDQLRQLFKNFARFDQIYAPAVMGGNWQHDFIGEVAQEVFPSVIKYITYTKTVLSPKGSIEVKPTPQEISSKNSALDCYKSQINLASTAPHFEAMRGKSEWYA